LRNGSWRRCAGRVALAGWASWVWCQGGGWHWHDRSGRLDDLDGLVLSGGAAQCGCRGVVLAASWVGLGWYSNASISWGLDGSLNWSLNWDVGAWGCYWGLLGDGTDCCVHLDNFRGYVAELRGAVRDAWSAGCDCVD